MADSSSKRLRDALVHIRNTKVLHDQELDTLLSMLLSEMQDIKGELVACKKQIATQQAFINHFHQDYQTFIKGNHLDLQKQYSLEELMEAGKGIHTADRDDDFDNLDLDLSTPRIEALPRIEQERKGNLAAAAKTTNQPQRPAVPVTAPQIRILDGHERSLLSCLSRSLETAIKQLCLISLAVPKSTQQSLQANASSGLQLEETKQPTPHYYGDQSPKCWLLVPNPTTTWPPSMVQQVGLDMLFELRPAKLSAPKKIKQILAPARMNRSGDNWTVVQQGILEFEA